jgi:hypothetical protein
MREALGLAHVASVSFVGARIAPSAQFWLTLPGGVAVARAAEREGFAAGVGASLAATLQGIAILGPIRVNAPLTQAISAPPLGRLEARRASFATELAVCLVLRVLHYLVLNALAIWLVLGGVDGLVKTYEAITGWLGFLPEGTAAALAITFGWQLLWAVVLSVIQVAVYRRALRRWPAGPPPRETAEAAEREPAPRHAWAMATVALVLFVVLLATTQPFVLAGVAAALGIACLVARPEARIMRIGAGLALLLGGSALLAGMIGGFGFAIALRRGIRAALLVLVASWLRGAAGPEGTRQVFRGVLARLRRFSWAREAAALLDRLDTGARLTAAGRTFVDALSGVPQKPGPIADATTAWVAAEAARGPAH